MRRNKDQSSRHETGQPGGRRSARLALLAVLCSLGASCDQAGPHRTPPDSERPLEPSAERDERHAARRGTPISQPPDVPINARLPLPQFRMVGADAGLDFERYDDISGQRRILETNGGGVAVLDYDRDGWLDVFFPNGCRFPAQPGDHSTPSALFRQREPLQFERISDSSQLLQFGFACGCAVGDFDADGFDDLYVTAFRGNTLWKNNGDGTFIDVTDQMTTAVPVWSTSAAFADVNNDGILDLYVTNYLDESETDPRLCPNPQSPDGYQGCSPALFDGLDDVLFLGNGRGGFLDVSDSAGIAGHPGKGLGVVIADLDRNGTQEIFVANDGEANFLFVWSGEAAGSELVYEERAVLSGLALNERGFAQASMGIAATDFDRNGLTDLFLTHFFSDTNTLYLNRGGLAFRDATRGSGLGASSRQTLGFGTVPIDVDNDGWEDVFVANGHVDDRTWMQPSQPYQMPAQFYQNARNGRFTDVSDWSGPYFQKAWLGRGVVAADLDHDGRQDLLVSHQLAPAVLLQNQTPAVGGAIVLELVGTTSVRSGYGATVSVVDVQPAEESGLQESPREPLVREVVGGGSFQSGAAPRVHLGLENAESANIRIEWPSGHSQIVGPLRPGRWTVVEDKAAAVFPEQWPR